MQLSFLKTQATLGLCLFTVLGLSACNSSPDGKSSGNNSGTSTAGDVSTETDTTPNSTVDINTSGGTVINGTANPEGSTFTINKNGETIIDAKAGDGSGLNGTNLNDTNLEKSGTAKVKINLPGIKVDMDGDSGSLKVNSKRLHIDLNSSKEAR